MPTRVGPSRLFGAESPDTDAMTDPAPLPEADAAGTGKASTGSGAATGGWLPSRSVLALVVAVVALGFSAAPWIAPDLFGGRVVRAYMLSHPQVLDEVVAAHQAREDGQRAEQINAAVSANPALLQVDARDPSFGPADAKVTVIEFFDFRCPGCKAVAPDFMRLMQAHPDVRFVFKDWPILDRGEDAVSHYAARAALAAHAQGRYLPVYQALMAQPSLDEATVDRVLAEQGVDPARARAAMAGPEIASHLADIQTIAMAFRLTGTPTFLINGKATNGISPDEVNQAIATAKR
jgi:protein-disulfide isomerase